MNIVQFFGNVCSDYIGSSEFCTPENMGLGFAIAAIGIFGLSYWLSDQRPRVAVLFQKEFPLGESLRSNILENVAKHLSQQDMRNLSMVSTTMQLKMVNLKEKQQRLEQYCKNLADLSGQKPADLEQLPRTMDYYARFEAFQRARDTLFVWYAIAKETNQMKDFPDFEELRNVDDYLAAASRFANWAESHCNTRSFDLFLSSSSLSFLPKELSYFQNLRRLDLNYNQIVDLSPISSIAGIVSLEARGNQIKDLSPLSGLKKLFILNLEQNFVSNLAPLAGLGDLNCLDLSKNKVQSVTPLASLNNLEGLFLTDNHIQKIAPICGLTRLETLFIDGNPIKDPSSLDALSNVKIYGKNSIE